MATLVIQDRFAKDVLDGLHNFNTGHSFKIVLSNSAIASSVSTLGGITEITAGGGYSSGGFAVTVSTSSPSTRQGAFTVADVTLTASSTINTFRYLCLINVTAGNIPVASTDLGTAVNLSTGGVASLTFDFAATALTLL
jgi:hypothetical protein